MKINKHYFSYLFTSKKIGWIFFFVMYIAIALSSLISSGTLVGNVFATIVTIAGMESIILAFVLPIFLLSFVHHKTSCDLYFALPIKRSDMICTIIAFSFTICFGFYVCTILISYLFTLFSTNTIHLVPLLGSSAFLALGILTLLVVNSMIYLFANNVIDGIIILGAYTVIPLLYTILCSGINDILFLNNANTMFFNGIFLSPITMVYANFIALTAHLYYNTSMFMGTFSWIYTILLVVYCCISCYGLHQQFVKRKTERAGSVSNDFFSYPFIINIYTLFMLTSLACSILTGFVSNYFILVLLTFLCYALALFIYKRKLQITWKNICTFVLMAALTVGITQFTFMNKGFNIPKNYSLTYGNKITYSINAYQITKDLTHSEVSNEKDTITYHFDLSIPTDQISDNKYKNVVSILEKYRHACIDTWYTSAIFRQNNAYVLAVENKQDRNSHKEYHYVNSTGLTLEELQTISKLTPVLVEVYNNDDYSLHDIYPLDQYIKEVLNNDSTIQS